MRRIILVFLLCTMYSYAQNSGPILTADDLRTAFLNVCKGDSELTQTLTEIGKYGDAIIPPLLELLSTPLISGSDSIPVPGTIKIPIDTTSTGDSIDFIEVPDTPFRSDNIDSETRQRQIWFYSAMALEGIGSGLAYSSLQDLARSHSDKDVRGFAVNALSNSYYDKCVSDTTHPNSEVLHVLITNIDDTTRVATLESSIGSIARGGIRRWTDIDFGEFVQPSSGKKRLRETWWQNIGSKLKWNKTVGRYE